MKREAHLIEFFPTVVYPFTLKQNLPVKIIVLDEDFPQSSMKCITSPIRNEGWPVNTIQGHLKSF